MKIKILVLVFLLSTSLLFAADTILSYLTAKSDGESIKIEWQTNVEEGINRFVVERLKSSNNFIPVTTVYAKGKPAHYSWTDEEAFSKTEQDKESAQSKNVFQYHLKIIYTDGTETYSDPVTAVHNVNSITRTWGMIKEMFR